MFSGYLCFVVSISCIGVVTAIIGDVASHFGCTLGIKDSVTAICFVALGTSIPGNLKTNKNILLRNCRCQRRRLGAGKIIHKFHLSIHFISE